MTAGAAQTMLKSSGLLPNGQVLLGGQGPLLWLLAAQILRSGGVISRILDTNDRTNWRAALPHALSFLGSAYFTKGLRLMREVKARVPVVSGVTDLIASGDQQLRSVSYTVAGQRQSVAADVLLLHQGVVPNVNLAMAAGVEHRWDETQLCWVPVLTANGDTSVDGIAIAGDGGGINGALAAIALGKIAGRAAVEAISAEAAAPLPPMAQLQAECGRAMRGRSFLDRLFRPSPKFRIPTGDTIVCRCEEVTAAEILEAINIGATGPNQLKAYRRTGMGPCQGRMCGLTVTELMGKARDKSPSEIGYFRIRAPVKPITLAELAALPKDENAIKAVERG
jgi:bacterioferritin-associated ferredoxin